MQQTCRALGQLPTSPRLHFSVADYQTLTRHGELCNANGCLGIDEFETVMREQVYGYINSPNFDTIFAPQAAGNSTLQEVL